MTCHVKSSEENSFLSGALALPGHQTHPSATFGMGLQGSKECSPVKRACRAPYETTSHTAVKRPQMSRSAPIALTCLRLVYGQTVPRIAGQCILPM